MIRLAVMFVVIALSAAFLGYAGRAGLSWEASKTILVVFLILAVLSCLGGTYRGRSFLR
jgi:uncharacterized membrane protein YtjA (UPF0391 family)